MMGSSSGGCGFAGEVANHATGELVLMMLIGGMLLRRRARR
jgi:hypothetical protein